MTHGQWEHTCDSAHTSLGENTTFTQGRTGDIQARSQAKAATEEEATQAQCGAGSHKKCHSLKFCRNRPKTCKAWGRDQSDLSLRVRSGSV